MLKNTLLVLLGITIAVLFFTNNHLNNRIEYMKDDFCLKNGGKITWIKWDNGCTKSKSCYFLVCDFN